MRLTLELGLPPGGGLGIINPLFLIPDLWIEALDIATLFQDGNHTIPVTADLDPVGAWFNQGAGDQYFQMATANKMPVYHSSGALVVFDGSNDELEANANRVGDFVAASQFDVLCAGAAITCVGDSNDSGTTNSANIISALGGAFFSVGAATQHNGDGIPNVFCHIYDGVDHRVVHQPYTSGTPFVLHGRLSGGVMSVNLNGGAYATLSVGDIADVTNEVGIGLSATGAVFSAMSLAAIFSRKTILSATDLAGLKHYLGNRVGLSL